MPRTTRSSADRTGSILSGRFRLDQVVGRGGQSVIYRARDLRDGDDVAIKVLNDDVARDAEWVERMFRESEAMASLLGTAAVRVFGQAWTEDGSMAIVMELLHGVDLEEHLTQLEARGETLSPEALLEILAPVAKTLDAAHQRGIVHRDLKPSNVFVLEPVPKGGVRLLDFGFAKFVRRRGPTAHGTIAGSPSYIPPEAWREGSGGLDQRVDVYAFGAVVFRALGGRPPFDASDLIAMVREVTQGERPSLRQLRPELPVEIDAWVEQSLAIDPGRRFLRVGGQFAALSFVLSH
jgi:serine/threonine protein kinase